MIPNDCVIKKSCDLLKRLSDEDKKLHHKEAMNKWLNKEYVCPKCGNEMKNSNRRRHNNICE